jgi:hypothetical protein
MKKQSIIASTAMLLFVVASFVTAGGIYTWTDTQGEVHYGDRVPTEYQSRASKLESHTPRAHPQKRPIAAATLQQKLDKLNGIKQQHAAQKLKAEQEQTAKNTRTKNCGLAKNNLKTMQERARIRVKEKNGEYRMLSHEEKTEKESEIKEQIKEFCAK